MPVGTLSLEGHAADEVELVAEVLCPLFVESPLAEACQLEEAALMAVVEDFHGKRIPAQEQRLEASEKDVTEFVDVTVPATIDRQSGIVARKLRKAHDTFDIENAKILKREQKITQRFETHIRRSAQASEDERATRASARATR